MPLKIGRLTAEIQDASGEYGAYQVGVELAAKREPDLHD
jgi:hypothetical protein